jgi:hypothetical protein
MNNAATLLPATKMVDLGKAAVANLDHLTRKLLASEKCLPAQSTDELKVLRDSVPMEEASRYSGTARTAVETYNGQVSWAIRRGCAGWLD